MKKQIKKYRWVSEALDLPYDDLGTKINLQVKKKLFSGESLFQKIKVYNSIGFGRILLLDGAFQTSERDEFIYHEMISHLPLFYHRNPKKVLIIGGGDGGTLEEVLKHPIEKVWMVEIDKKVIEVSKKYLSSISKRAFKDKRAEVVIGDGVKFIKDYKSFFDVIILDLSDPWGPAKKLISKSFYKNIRQALKKDGFISAQSGSFFCQSELVALISRRLRKIFSFVKVHRAPVLIYGVGDFSFTIASDVDFKKADFKKIKKRFENYSLKLKYYSPEIHFSSAILPKYLRDIFNDTR